MHFHRPNPPLWLVQSALALTLSFGQAQAQTPPQTTLPGVSPTAYVGPHFPGGPDSLAAVLGRATRAASPALVGQVFLHLTLDARGQVSASALLPPPARTPAARLFASAEVQKVAQRLVSQLPAWQPANGVPRPGDSPGMVVLPLTFGPLSATRALAYGDDEPTFSAARLQALAGGRPSRSLAEYVQRQVRYPAQALRSRQQGTVYAYFEVSETGLVEQPRIVGSAGETLDEEGLRALKLVPPATVPARYQGRPVRVYYVVPVAFKML